MLWKKKQLEQHRKKKMHTQKLIQQQSKKEKQNEIEASFTHFRRIQKTRIKVGVWPISICIDNQSIKNAYKVKQKEIRTHTHTQTNESVQ